MSSRLIEFVEKLSRKRIVLIGDLMLDRTLFGNAERLSPEAPVPVLHFKKEQNAVGGAGNVAANLSVLGSEVRVIGIIGDDEPGRHIRKLLSEYGVDSDYIATAATRPTISKVRLVGLAQHRHPQQLLRLDYEDASIIDDRLAAHVYDCIVKAMDGADGICIEDYNKGLLSPDMTQKIIKLARSKQIPVFVDPASIADYSKYKGATTITPNATETTKATGMPVTNVQQYQAAADALLNQLDLEAAVLTLDKNGAYLATRDGERKWLKTKERKVYDVTGAGDMVLAMLTVARIGGASWSESVALSNVAGGLEVERFGVVPITRQEIIQELLTESHEHVGKQRTMEQLLIELDYHRASGRKIVFTNGCFDLIHLGHVKYFRFAKAQGDLLVVGINTDNSIRRLKGDKRPIICEDDRVSVLEELESIDYLIRFDDDTPADLIKQIRPDVLVKGADYKKEQVVGWDFVESYGGKVALAPLIEGRSTSAVIQRILETNR